MFQFNSLRIARRCEDILAHRDNESQSRLNRREAIYAHITITLSFLSNLIKYTVSQVALASAQGDDTGIVLEPLETAYAYIMCSQAYGTKMPKLDALGDRHPLDIGTCFDCSLHHAS